jgi:hypothetical protein
MTPPAATVAARRAGRAGSASRIAPAPRPHRRVSGPARPAAVPRPARRPDLTLGARALAWLRTLPDHRLLDRLIGGRIWIVLLGTLLVGIVTMQLTLLRLNAGIGRAVERGGALEQRNAALRMEISQLSDGERIVALATQMGYVTPPQGSPRFLTAGAGDAGKALTTMRVPDPSAAATATSMASADTTTIDPAATAVDPTTIDPAAAGSDPAATGTDPAATTTTDPAVTAPATGTATTDPAASAPTTGTTAPPTGASAPTTGTAGTAAGGAAAAPLGTVGGQG